MDKRLFLSLGGAALLACASLGIGTASAADPAPAELDCKLSFSLTGWAALYKHAEGEGTVHCADGATLPVRLSVTGGGLTAGKWRVDDGTGVFSDVHDISEVLGNYVQGEAHAGAVKSSSAQVLTKGTVSLALAGTGEGVDLGVDIGKFSIEAR